MFLMRKMSSVNLYRLKLSFTPIAKSFLRITDNIVSIMTTVLLACMRGAADICREVTRYPGTERA